MPIASAAQVCDARDGDRSTSADFLLMLAGDVLMLCQQNKQGRLCGSPA